MSKAWISQSCVQNVRMQRVCTRACHKSPIHANFRESLSQRARPSLRVEMSAFVNRFLLATFIMHEKCLPTGPDRNISSVSPRYRSDRKWLACRAKSFRHDIKDKYTAEKFPPPSHFFIIGVLCFNNDIDNTYKIWRIAYASQWNMKLPRHSRIEQRGWTRFDEGAFDVTPLSFDVNIYRSYAKPVPMAVGWANSANWI